MAQYLTAPGLPVGHERMEEWGVSSWMFAADAASVPETKHVEAPAGRRILREPGAKDGILKLPVSPAHAVCRVEERDGLSLTVGKDVAVVLGGALVRNLRILRQVCSIPLVR